MTAKPDCVSDLLRELQQDLSAIYHQHGVIHFDRAGSAGFISNIGRIADLTRKLENAWSQAEWNRRALVDRAMLLSDMNRVSAEVLGLMRPDTEDGGNVIPFRAKPDNSPPSAPPGGDAA